MSDARTEARRRIAAAVAPMQPDDAGVFASADEIADAVLELFVTVNFDLVVKRPVRGQPAMRQLVMFGPVEPVVPEESRDG